MFRSIRTTLLFWYGLIFLLLLGAFGTVAGLATQTGAVPPTAQTPNVKPPGVAVKLRA